MGKPKDYKHTYIGYVPSNWLEKAFALPGRDTAKVAVLLWLSYSFGWHKGKGSQDIVHVTDAMAAWFHVQPKSRNRAMDRLVEAGLCSYVTHGVGKRPIVRLHHTKIRRGLSS
jgi:hypothetical protein